MDDWIHIGCNIFLRVSSVLNNTIELKPELLGPHIEKVQYTTSIFDLVCAGTRCTKDMVLPLIRYLRHRPNPINMVIVIPKDNNLPSELKIDAKWAENIQFILSAKGIDVFDVIPELFQYDEVLKQFICSLTKKPIRHPVVVQGTEDNPQPIYFERKEINERLDDCSLGCPEAWPADIQYSRKSLKDAEQIQHQINRRLNILLSEMKGLPIYGLQSSIQNGQLDKLCQLALNIGFNQEDKPDDLLVDDMLSNMHQSIVPLIANITVYTLPYFFEPNSATLTRKILIFPQQTLLKKTTSLTEKELSDATFSLLGSENLQHTHTLKAAFRIFSRVEIYISTDLRHHKVKWS